MDGYFEEINGNEYLTLVPANESKEKIKKYEELWSKIRDLIGSITKISDEYDKKYMKIKFNWDEKLPLNKTIEVSSVIIVVKTLFLMKVININYKFFLMNVCINYRRECRS